MRILVSCLNGGKKHCRNWFEFIQFHSLSMVNPEPRVAPSNVQVVDGTVTDTEATLQWEQVDLDPEVLQGFFRGYRVRIPH